MFACACCRRVRDRFGEVVRVAEEFADGRAGEAALAGARELAAAVAGDAADSDSTRAALAAAACARDARTAARDAPELAGIVAIESAPPVESDGRGRSPRRDEGDPEYEVYSAERAAQADLLRDVFGTPLRPATVRPEWLTITVVALAHTIYEDRAFDRLPILADALEEAGCDNVDLLVHCRGDGPHVRGCWAVDLLLGKE